MADHLLVPVDESSQSEAALAFAVEEWPEAAITLVHVVNPVEAGYSATGGVPAGAEDWYAAAEAEAEELLAAAADRHDREFETRIEVGSPSTAIVEAVEDGPYDHVVLGSHGRTGISRVLLGSVAEAVVRGSPVPVTVAR